MSLKKVTNFTSKTVHNMPDYVLIDRYKQSNGEFVELYRLSRFMVVACKHKEGLIQVLNMTYHETKEAAQQAFKEQRKEAEPKGEGV